MIKGMHINPKLVAMLRSERVTFAVTIGFGSMAGICAVLFAWLMSKSINGAFINGDKPDDLLLILTGMGIVAGLRALTQWGSEAAAGRLAVNIKLKLRLRLLEHLFLLGPAYTQGELGEQDVRTGELTNSITDGVEGLDAYFSQYLPQVVLSAIIPLSIVIFILPLDPLSGMVLLLTAPLIPIFMILIGSSAEAMNKRQWLSLSRMSAYILDMLQGLSTLKLMGKSRTQLKIIEDLSERFRGTTMEVLRVTFLSALVLELVTTISTAVVAVQIGLRLLYGHLGFEEAFFVLLLAPEFYLPLRMLGTRFHAGLSGVASAARILDILEMNPGYKATEESTDDPELSSSKNLMGPQPEKVGNIQFKDVSVHYADGRVALKNINFEIEEGTRTALIGASGAGKSTIIRLILGFIVLEKGDIRVDGLPHKDIPMDMWRENIAWISQENYLFNDSVEANIRLGKPQATRIEVEQAAKHANAHDFILELPNGYETKVGEQGARLSSGQKQRIALARAFLKDAPILIMDEPSAHLDSENETLIMDALDQLMSGRTTIMIAHRLKTIYDCDQIILLDEGRIEASGMHQELLVRSEMYRRLVAATDEIIGEVESNHKTSAFRGEGSRMLPESGRTQEQTAQPTYNEKSYATIKRLVRFLAPYKLRVVLSVVLGWATIFCGIGLMSTSAFIVGRAAQHPPIAALQVAIVGVRFFGISRGFFRYLERLASHDLTLRIQAKLRLWLYKAIEPLTPARLSAYRSGDLLKRMTGDINSLESLYVRGIAPPFVAILVVVSSGIILSSFNLILAIIYVLFILVAGLVFPWIILKMSQRPGKEIIRIRGEMSASIVDGLQGLPDLLTFGAARRYKDYVSEIQNKLAAAQSKLITIGSMQAAGLGLFSQLATLAVMSMGIGLVGTGHMQGLFLGVISLLVLTSFEALQPIPQAAQVLASNLEVAKRLFVIAETTPAVKEPIYPLSLDKKLDLEVHELNFSYPSSIALPCAEVLKSISFKLPHGKHMAIVGPSGAGKSTLISLLVRFYDIPTGSILLNGKDISQYMGEEVREKIAVVPQNPYLFTATILDNLRIACPQSGMAEYPMDEINDACRVAHIHDFIEGLPQGFSTWVGEHGFHLSAGERQRLAVSRALLMNAPLLVLDEATANLDVVTEQYMMQDILKAMRSRSVLIITHRLVGMEGLDEILVLDRGRVVERGKHVELLRSGGLYRYMWDIQHGAQII